MTTWVSWYQKGKTSLDINEARDDGVLGWQWHQLDHIPTICTSLQTDTPSLEFSSQILFKMPNQQHQSNEGKNMHINNNNNTSTDINYNVIMDYSHCKSRLLHLVNKDWVLGGCQPSDQNCM